MKKFSRLCAVTAILAIILSLCGISVNASQYPDTLRVGIYYGSTAVPSMNFTCSNGFALGASSGKSFYPFRSVSDTSVTVSRGNVESYYIMYSTHNGADEMNSQINTLGAAGLNVFPAFYNSMYCVLGGNFSNYNDALWEAENGEIQGTPVALSANALYAKNSSSGQILFALDIQSYGLAVYNREYGNPDILITASGSAGGTYRGGFECKALSGGNLTVVNIVPVESYLYSVVCREMSPSWPVEALKAQAVCARNFALNRINHHHQYGFDVCRTVCCQVYSNNADQSQSVHTAVDQTRGELLFYGNSLVNAVYSSSMGATTESVEYVWGTAYPYLVSVDNSYENTQNINNGVWTNTLTAERASQLMKEKGADVGTVTEITALEYSPSGRVIKLLVKGTHGEKIFEREACRTVFKEATLSQKYTVTSNGTKTPPLLSVISKNGTETLSRPSLSVLSGNDYTSVISGLYAATDGVTQKTYQALVSNAEPDIFTFSGEGWGHGVGMSQFGAKGMAEAGIGYSDILTHYYTGTKLTKAY